MPDHELNPTVTEERRYKAFELKKTGATYKAIGDELGVNPSTAYRDVRWVLDQIQPSEQDIEGVRKLEVERLEGYLFKLKDDIAKGDHQAIDRAIKINARVSAIKGLDIQRHEVGGEGGGPVTISVVYEDKK
jgi:hypothetical protein